MKKPRVVAGEILPREILHVTLLMDHDVIDGAPMARFVQDFVKRMENV